MSAFPHKSKHLIASRLVAAIAIALSLAGSKFALADEPNLAKEEPKIHKSENSELVEPVITPGEREHWSFKPLLRPELPAVKRGDWCRNEIDRFVLAKLEEAKLSP